MRKLTKMQIQNKTEIKLNVEDLTKIVTNYLEQHHKVYGTIKCDWMVKNKPIREKHREHSRVVHPLGAAIATSWRDSMDNYVFDGVDITVTT